MDFNGERRRIPLIEEPRRPPWKVIGILLAGVALIVATWIALDIRIEFELPKAEADADAPAPTPENDRRSVELEERVRVRLPEGAPVPAPRPGGGARWANQPVPDYPRAGLRAPGGEGRVTLTCLVQPNLSLGACRALREDPEGYGFAESAIEAAGRARLTSEAQPGARVTYTVRYVTPEG
jgi:hypothetical protein